MRAYLLVHLDDATVLLGLAASASRDCRATAWFLAHIAEADARRLYARAGYHSMHAYCVDVLHLSEDAAYKRIQAARAARRFPEIFEAVADSRLHLAAVCLLAPHLTPENASELIAAATHRRKSEIELLLAARFPRPDVASLLRGIPAVSLAPAQAGIAMPCATLALKRVGIAMPCTTALASGQVGVAASCETESLALAQANMPRARLQPLSAERFALQVTLSKRTHDKLRQAQELLSHALPSGDVSEVLDRALDALLGKLLKQKCAAAANPRLTRKSSDRRRHIPAQVRRAVWERDGGRCTFVGDNGHRCTARRMLELDHVEPVARGGRASVDGIRLRCRVHNQYEAERVFGTGFMDMKREGARQEREARAQRTEVAGAETVATCANAPAAGARDAAQHAPAHVMHTAPAAGADVAQLAPAQVNACKSLQDTSDLIAGLRALGFRIDEARRAVVATAGSSQDALEVRMKAALRYLCPRAGVSSRPAHT